MTGSVYPCEFCHEQNYVVDLNEHDLCPKCAKTYERRVCNWDGCSAPHNYWAVIGCDRCGGHGPSHYPFTKGHQPHCTMNCCF